VTELGFEQEGTERTERLGAESCFFPLPSVISAIACSILSFGSLNRAGFEQEDAENAEDPKKKLTGWKRRTPNAKH
jgi:hypothetical protein